MSATDADVGTDIAIVGMAGRFPGANSVQALWDLLSRGGEAFAPASAEKAHALGAGRLLDNPDYVPVTAEVDQIDGFDAVFFGYNAQQATELDPQQRVFLECAWHALEDAACDPETFEGSVGVFAGSGLNRYALLRERQPQETLAGYNQTLASDKDFLATRASYKLGLTGPSMAVQTACSTSLVAVHVACQNLLLQECDLALAGGVSLQVPQGLGYVAQEGGILSPDGHCRAFDVNARGTVPGSGVAAVALQRLSDALESGRRIYAVIKSSAVNNDGADKVGFTAPSVGGQVDLLTQAHAGLDTARITMLEAHGTGTQLGDAIELKALDRVFGEVPSKAPFCAIGSIKTNIGHLDTAAGVTGLIKTALCLHNKTLVPSLNFSAPHPALESSRALYVNTELRSWPDDGHARRAAVSSFGLGGTNAHVVLEQAPDPSVGDAGEDHHLFPLSASSASALAEGRTRLAEHLRAHPEQSLADVARTLQVGRKAFRFRHVFGAADRNRLLEQLEADRLDYTAVKDRDVSREATLLLSDWNGALVDLAGALHRQGDPDVQREVEALCASLPAAQADAVRAGFAGEAGGAAAECDPQSGFAAQYVLANVVARWIPGMVAVVGEGQGRLTALCIGGRVSARDVLATLHGGHAAGSGGDRASATLRLLSPVTNEPLPADEPLPSLTSLIREPGQGGAREMLQKAGGPVLELGSQGFARASDGSLPRARLLEAAGELWLRGGRGGLAADVPQLRPPVRRPAGLRLPAASLLGHGRSQER
jgi:acyl transferase domain-containing protein